MIDGSSITVMASKSCTDYGINQRECGLRYKPKQFEITYNQKCFKNKNPKLILLQHSTPFIEVLPENRLDRGSIVTADYHESPWTVNVREVGWESPLDCTGVLISFQWVLTAAICKANLVRVSAGSNTKTGIEQLYADKWFIHPKVGSDSEHERDQYNMALIKLKGQFSADITDSYGNYFINTICLPESNVTNDEYDRGTFFGFGRSNVRQVFTSFGDHHIEYTDHLFKNRLLVGPSQFCRERKLCALCLHCEYASCLSNFGGGLVQYIDSHQIKGVLIGILSSSTRLLQPNIYEEDCKRTAVNLFSSVSLNVKWILDTVKDNS